MSTEEERVLDTFLDLVRIDSPSGEEDQVAEYCERALNEMGFDVTFDESRSRTASNTGNLIARLEGTSGHTLMLSAHMDCVEPCRGIEPVVANGRVSSSGETVLGADDKAGIAAILEAARRIIAAAGPRPTLMVVLTVSEETGLTGAKALDLPALDADMCLVLDADGRPGGIVIAAPTHYTFLATFHGQAAHAGVAPEQGISAIAMASKAICSMELGRLDEMSTANIGSIEGGTATNVIPASTSLTGECRSLDIRRAEEIKQRMEHAMHDAAEAAGGRLEIAWTREYVGFSFDENADVVRAVSDAATNAGLIPCTLKTGGGSDGNVFAEAGIPTLVLSCGMSSVHSTSESIAVEDLYSMVDFVQAVAVGMAGG